MFQTGAKPLSERCSSLDTASIRNKQDGLCWRICFLFIYDLMMRQQPGMLNEVTLKL